MGQNVVVAQRTLTAAVAGNTIEVAIQIFLPRPHSTGIDWACDYEIVWPSAVRRNSVSGVDSVQALFLALQFIGAELYAGRPSELDNLTWLEHGQGFGFLLPPNLREIAIGEDKLL